jgi:L-ribulose-5-phosphate 3-epimerase
MNRRQFAKSTILTSAMVSMNPFSGFSSLISKQSVKLKKGIMWGTLKVGETILEKFQAAAKAGFEGIEVYSHLDRQEVIKARDITGLVIPSICGALHGKFPLSSADPAIRAKGSDALKVTLEDAKIYGADTVLLVPGSVNQSVSYDECWNRSIEEINKLIPFAENLNVKIAIENVWNNFLLSPLEAANYVDQFKNPIIGFYFDCGNILVYGWPEQWIKILGKRIAKVHIKEFSVKNANTNGKSAGFNVKLQEGDVNWPAVIKALNEIGYTGGWTTLEQSGGDTPEGLKDLCDRLGNILKS